MKYVIGKYIERLLIVDIENIYYRLIALFKMEIKTYINKNETKTIKGIAILLMVVHHVLTFKVWWPQSFIPSNGLLWFADHFNEPTRLCVALYAFITGYFFFYRTNKDEKYYIPRKSIKFLINYWAILFVLLGSYFITVEGGVIIY